MLPSELFRGVRKVEIVTRRLVNEVFAGEYQSVFKGRGMEFSEVREYADGDDIRTIDWNVTARMNRPFVKKYVEERELTVVMALDASASGDFGTVAKMKREAAAELSALLVFSALKSNDRVGLVIFTDRVEKFVPPKKGRNHLPRIVRELLYFQPAHRATSIPAVLEYLSRVMRRQSVVFLISDFIARGYERPLQVASRRHDIIPIVLSDRREGELPRVGFLRLYDAETGAEVVLDTDDPRVRAAFSHQARRRREELEHLFRSLGLDSIFLEAGESYIIPLFAFFRARARRLGM